MVFSSRVSICVTMVDTQHLSADRERIEANAIRVAEKYIQNKRAIIDKLFL